MTPKPEIQTEGESLGPETPAKDVPHGTEVMGRGRGPVVFVSRTATDTARWYRKSGSFSKDSPARKAATVPENKVMKGRDGRWWMAGTHMTTTSGRAWLCLELDPNDIAPQRPERSRYTRTPAQAQAAP